MSQPTPYDRSFSFTNYQSVNPTAPLPGNSLDAELNDIKTTDDQILQNLALIQRDDGALASASVGFDQLSPDVTFGISPWTAWAPSTAYFSSPASVVFYSSQVFRCITSHTSGSVFDSTKWVLLADFSAIAVAAASNVAFTPAGTVTASTVQAAIQQLDTLKSPVGHTHVSTDITDSTASGRTLLTAASVAAQLAALGLTNTYANSGDIKATAALSLPSGWLWCDGSAVNRATYAALLAAISVSYTGNLTNGNATITSIADTSKMRAGYPVSGTGIQAGSVILSVVLNTSVTLDKTCTSSVTGSPFVMAPWGIGDGSTTFNVPDYRGKIILGVDDMGGSEANNVTLAGSGIAGNAMGGQGGAQSVTLNTTQIPSHTHTLTSNTETALHTHQGLSATLTGFYATSVTATPNTVPGYTFGATATGTESALHQHSATSDATGGGTSHTNMPPIGICNIVIKT